MAGHVRPAHGSPPAIVDEFVALVASGALVDLIGRSLVWTTCESCRCRVAVGGTCPTILDQLDLFATLATRSRS